LASIVVLILAQQLDTRVLGPRLLDPSLRLHPITVLLSLLIGGSLLGLWGMLLAVPIVMVGKVIVLYVWDTRSQWPPPGAVADPRAPAGSESDGPAPAHGSASDAAAAGLADGTHDEGAADDG